MACPPSPGKNTSGETTHLLGSESRAIGIKREGSFEDRSDEADIAHGYDIQRLTSMRVFGVLAGTVFNESILHKETAVTSLLYLGTFGVLFYFRWEHFGEFVGKESTIRAFLAMFSTLIGLLLSFYTSMNMTRWWQMRLGVQDVWDGCSKLTILLSQGVTRDKEVLNSVHRYARASLFKIFAASQKVDLHPTIILVQRGILHEDEAKQLRTLAPPSVFTQAETLWAWLANLVTRLHMQGLTQGPPHYCTLLAAVEQGRCGITKIQTYLETPIPMGYVHLLGMMVKLHNVILVIMIALLSVKHSGGRHGTNWVSVGRLMFRAFFMPFLYNALLVINTIVSDPFNGDVGDLSFKQFDDGIRSSAETFILAADNYPGWFDNKNFEAFNKK